MMIINPYYADDDGYLLILVKSLPGWSPLGEKAHSENPGKSLIRH